jgi:hypothetical protein
VIAHLVLFRPRPDLSVDDRRALADSLATALRQIPSIRSARIGRRVTHGRAYEALMHVNYEYAAALEFEDLAGLKLYLAHPAHEGLAARFFESVADALMYDFDLKDGEEGIRALL